MQAPPKLFLNLLYKMEGPHRDEFTVALELTTWDSDTCHEGHITPLPGEDPAHPPVLPAVSAPCRARLSPSLPFSQSPTADTTPGSSQHHHLASPHCSLPAAAAPRAGPAGECPAGALRLWVNGGSSSPVPALPLCSQVLRTGAARLRAARPLPAGVPPAVQPAGDALYLPPGGGPGECPTHIPAPGGYGSRLGARLLSHLPLMVPCSLLQVLDAASVAASPPQVQSLTASQLWWQEGPDAQQLSLSLTLRWDFPPGRANHFRVLSLGTRCRRDEPQQPQLLGLAHACLFRVVGLAVPRPAAGQSCQLELLVEPVQPNELPVDPDRWGRLVLVYSEPAGDSS